MEHKELSHSDRRAWTRGFLAGRAGDPRPEKWAGWSHYYGWLDGSMVGRALTRAGAAWWLRRVSIWLP